MPDQSNADGLGRSPEQVIVVAGTDTGIGKTWTSVRLIEELRTRGLTVAARKPVESFEVSDGSGDSRLLAEATGEARDVVCPPHRRYPVAMAPPIAAIALGLPGFTLEHLLYEMAPADAAVQLVETVGGPRSPISDDADSAGLATALQPDLVILVADSSLGAINAVKLAEDPLRAHRRIVLLNRFDPQDVLHVLNKEWLAASGSDVVTSISELADRVEAGSGGGYSVAAPDPDPEDA
ncbi:MAG TPA: dethiobiotin synthase [Actinomycetota bacterium]|nr:dethiobiotin synthase [Actinomycetota bacterium]